MLAEKQFVKFARNIDAWSLAPRLIDEHNRLCAVMLGYFDMAPWLSRSTDATIRRLQTIKGKEAVCASTGAAFTKREAAVNARNNDPAGRGALV